MQYESPNFATEENFKQFVTSLRGVIDLDKRAEKFSDKEKMADYLIENLLVIELKTFKSNPRDKVIGYAQSEMDKINQAEGFPILLGQHSFRKIAQTLLNGKEIINKFDNKYFRQIEGVMKNANKQIKSTIENLDMASHSYGVLIIINEQADLYQPEIVIGYICRELLRTNNEGKPRYSNIHQVALIQSSYKVNNTNNKTLIPCHFIKNSLLDDTELSQKAEDVMKFFWSAFARFVGVGNFHIKDPTDLPTTKLIKR